MKLTEIETGSRVFVDSNIFVYHFTGVSNECSDFLERCERGKLNATTTVSVVLEVLHCLMIVEATRNDLVKPPDVAEKLSQSPQTVRLLNEYFINTEKIQDMGIAIKPVLFDTLINSHVVRLTSGLMINDSLIIASMKQDRIKLLATSDKSFEPVTEIEICTPQDIKLS
jgi:predicted nucleic acid-binding protein